MTPTVNLLPQSYRQTGIRRRRNRMGAFIGVALITVELFAGLLLHARAGRVRDLLAAADAARATTQTIHLKMNEPKQESTLLMQQLALARRLRTTHHWSRLLSVYASASAGQVTLTAIGTDPPKWSPNMAMIETTAGQNKGKADGPHMLEGLSVRGCAGDHLDVSNFIKKVNAANAFATLDLLDVRRDKYMDQDVISFEIQCKW